MKPYLLTLFMLFVCFQPSLAGPLPDAPHIVVNGECEVRTTPDILFLSLGISETGFEVAGARDSVERRSRKLIHILKEIGIAQQDITAAQLQITPHYNWNNSAQIYAGTEVYRIVEVTLRDLSRYDDLIRSIVDARVARIQSTSLSSSEEKKLREEALRGAINDGMEKARIMVAHLPEQLGPVYSISPGSTNRPFLQARYEMANMAGQSAFEPGTILYKESIQLVFYLINGK